MLPKGVHDAEDEDCDMIEDTSTLDDGSAIIRASQQDAVYNRMSDEMGLVRLESAHIVFSSFSAETLFRDENVTNTKAENDETTLEPLQTRQTRRRTR